MFFFIQFQSFILKVLLNEVSGWICWVFAEVT